ncbi:MAG: hypothetical protein UU18_C0030G0005 [Parcubacteria group bacterium GW2011_GWB2_40_8]|nr:MAG: hypothetical protein UU18_C0030G0005 [Parcubacteria group bacterium GW2011_GWB2_40_8]
MSRLNLDIGGEESKKNKPIKPKVFVAMSGGVDSSVAALLLLVHGEETGETP